MRAPSGAVAFGSYQGEVGDVDFAPGLVARAVRHKRWVYGAIVAEALYVGWAVVRLGYASKLFAFAYDANDKRIVSVASRLGPPGVARVGRSSRAAPAAAWSLGRDRVRFGARAGGGRSLSLAVGDVAADLAIDDGPPAITAICALEDPDAGSPGASLTEKGALLPARGTITIAGRAREVDALAAYDYTSGILQRRTAWRWAFFMGRDAAGAPVAMNLVGGFMGEAECAFFTADGVFPLGEGRFTTTKPLDPWSIETSCGAAKLRFQPEAEHAEEQNLGLVKSLFHQPVGTFSGEVRVGGRTFEIRDVLGVCEDQSVVW